ncbi:MAG: aminopeptidase P family protein [Phocaeicola sp.]|nr:aminopeptidase P family protein [Phocaeicola sp.]
MKENIINRIKSLRDYMKVCGVSAFISPSTDPHSGEYVPEHWESRKWISGFTGSAGTAVITDNDGGVWTDSRYFIQAEEQLSGTGLKLFKDRLPETPSISEWLNKALKPGDSVGFDGWVNTVSEVQEIQKTLAKNNISYKMINDPYKDIWLDRPSIPHNKPFILGMEYTGESCQSKIKRIKEAYQKNQADGIVLSALDEIAWTLNLRGNDVHCNPVFVSYLIITNKETTLYIIKEKITEDVSSYLNSCGIVCKEYDEIETDLRNYNGNNIQMSYNTNYAIFNAAKSNAEVILHDSPVLYFKSIKNDTEIEGFRNAMTRDGVAMVKFLYWLEKSVGKENINEVTIDKKLTELRSQQQHFRGISFDTIAGYQEHGAIVHYEATEESALTLKPEGLLLLDSGAQYTDGTTDITRTIPLGETSLEQKKDYTLVLKGFIDVCMIEFPYGTCGTQLDILARQAMWKEGINYGHGTGHGVGHFLNVHEGPHQMRMNYMPAILLPGMTLTNEPGIYKAGRHGVRTENTMLIVKNKSTEFGEFYKFDQLTLCPISKQTIIKEMLTKEEIQWLNNYHKLVFEKISPFLEGEELSWLKDATSEL